MQLPQVRLEAKNFNFPRKIRSFQIKIFPETRLLTVNQVEATQNNNDWSRTVCVLEHFGWSNSRLELWRPRPESCLPSSTTLLPSLYSSLTDCYIRRFLLSLMTPSRGEAAEQWRRAPKSACCCGRTGPYARGRRYGGGRSLRLQLTPIDKQSRMEGVFDFTRVVARDSSSEKKNGCVNFSHL